MATVPGGIAIPELTVWQSARLGRSGQGAKTKEMRIMSGVCGENV